MRRTITQGEWDQFKAAHLAGAPLRQLARNAGINEGTMRMRASREKWSEQAAAARSLVAQAKQSDAQDSPAMVPAAQAAALTTAEGKRVLSLNEKRNFLRSVVTTPIGQVDESSPLAQSVKRRSRMTRNGDVETETDIRVPDKLRALELDAKLAGELDGSDHGGCVMVNVALLGLTLEERTVVDLTDAAGPDHEQPPPLTA